jgi:hypothetical protein
MKLSCNEMQIIGWISEEYVNWKVQEVERKSDREYDLRITGTQDGHNFAAWLPLASINYLVDWTNPRIAILTDYPEMAMSGDWSGVRDSSEEKIWKIFNTHVV